MTIKLQNYNFERKRRIKSLKTFDNKALLEWKKILKSRNIKKFKSLLEKYFILLKNLDYLHHNNQTYFSHPLRIACITFSLTKFSKTTKNLLILSLFHNIIETSNLKKKELNKLLGKKITKQIHILTIDRKRQWNIVYKNNYYRKINLSHKNTRIVKIIDKLDNLFTIGLCNSKLIRNRYIAEIEKYILPMVKRDIPNLSNYFEGLIRQSYMLGHYNYDEFRYKK